MQVHLGMTILYIALYFSRSKDDATLYVIKGRSKGMGFFEGSVSLVEIR